MFQINLSVKQNNEKVNGDERSIEKSFEFLSFQIKHREYENPFSYNIFLFNLFQHKHLSLT
jgi:hypothetical protein